MGMNVLNSKYFKTMCTSLLVNKLSKIILKATYISDLNKITQKLHKLKCHHIINTLAVKKINK